MPDFDHIAVLGFGTMGAGIAQLVAQSGCSITVLDSDADRIEVGRTIVSESLAEGVKRGKVTEDQRADISDGITATTKVEDLAQAQLVIEAVTERRDIKTALLARISEVVSAETIIATNTSALSVTDLAGSVSNPERFAGLHFFNPAPVMKVIEIVRALQTADTTIDQLNQFVHSIGKNPVNVKDRPGFLVNYLLMPYLNDVIQAYDDGLATAEDIDTAAKLGLGYKLGPFELLDLIGLDVHHHATRSAYEATFDSRFAPPPLLQQMVAAGYDGDKNGHGFRTIEEISNERI
jgi:3-hydroxybutyryl-CoA dehydrogenase